MSILDNLQRIKEQLFHHKHPFAEESVRFKKTYITGYTMLLCVDGYPSEMAKDELHKQLEALEIKETFAKLAIQQAMAAEDALVHNILNVLNEPMQKLVFMLDLYAYAQQDRKITEKEQAFLVLFEELLRLNYAEVHFVRNFRMAMLRQDQEVANKVVQAAFEQEVAVPLDALSYFLPGFVYEERLTTMSLFTGQKRKLTYATVLQGEVTVGQGAELDLNGMTVTFLDGASIIVDGGVIKADGATLQASMDANQTMLSIRNVGALTLQDVTFHGANNVRAIQMDNAQVTLEGCTFEKCFDEARGGALYFTNSEHFIVRDCTFEHCSSLGKGGAMYVAGTEASHMKARSFFGFRPARKVTRVTMLIEGCTFNETRAEMSGAIHMYEATAQLKNNTFTTCTSRIGGAAIDAYACTVDGQQNTFTACQAGLNEAVVMLKGDTLEAPATFGTFEACEPQTILQK
ncbi:MAG TPA: right-handed parallel beta-helix repeat-containing protein [Metalysinibacillus jejuensis]|uniref:Right-handed parallel beta-helix repeat-containing protein n=1 Tax=Metalysinibacillus jejuensis TaxID=914327 RepID=A0A921NC67_9BACL|nr:right-handed parallel beta-helix repeat-containing protein [Metalysinibacillus jejuensis]